DLVLGRPADDDERFAYSMCHAHYHFLSYATYRLVDADDQVVASGRKQAFCLLDTRRLLDEEGVGIAPRYTCEYQGLQRGWSDVYETGLPCQFLDITDVADGAYVLEIEVNPEVLLPELDLANNRIAIPLELGDPDLAGPTEACPEGLPDHMTAGPHRECGWSQGGTFPCTPGTKVHVGCADCLGGVGGCSGNPMIRVCDAARPDGNCAGPTALGSNDDSHCDGKCPLVRFLECPASGQLEVYVAPSSVGGFATCDVDVVPAAS